MAAKNSPDPLQKTKTDAFRVSNSFISIRFRSDAASLPSVFDDSRLESGSKLLQRLANVEGCDWTGDEDSRQDHEVKNEWKFEII